MKQFILLFFTIYTSGIYAQYVPYEFSEDSFFCEYLIDRVSDGETRNFYENLKTSIDPRTGNGLVNFETTEIAVEARFSDYGILIQVISKETGISAMAKNEIDFSVNGRTHSFTCEQY